MTPFFVSFLRYDSGGRGPGRVRSSSAFVSSAGKRNRDRDSDRDGDRYSAREVSTIDIRYVRSGNERSCRTRCSLRNRLAYPTLRRSRQGSGNFLAGRFCVFDCVQLVRAWIDCTPRHRILLPRLLFNLRRRNIVALRGGSDSSSCLSHAPALSRTLERVTLDTRELHWAFFGLKLLDRGVDIDLELKMVLSSPSGCEINYRGFLGLKLSC